MMSFLRTRSAKTKTEWKEAFARLGTVYVVRDDDAKRIKIGYSRRPFQRQGVLQVGCSGKLRMLILIAAPEAVEEALHRNYLEWHLHGEWFDDREEVVSSEIIYMTNDAPIGNAIWEIVPGKWEFHQNHPSGRAGWSALEYMPA
jgi:hypothetical protein